MTSSVENYLPIFIFLIIAVAFALILTIIPFFVSPKGKYSSDKNSPYECGFEEFDSARVPFDVRFYLVAILFIIFDLEIALLFPWAIVIREIGLFGFFSMIFFLFILAVGFIYEWKKGALDWK